MCACGPINQHRDFSLPYIAVGHKSGCVLCIAVNWLHFHIRIFTLAVFESMFTRFNDQKQRIFFSYLSLLKSQVFSDWPTFTGLSRSLCFRVSSVGVLATTALWGRWLFSCDITNWGKSRRLVWRKMFWIQAVSIERFDNFTDFM